MNAAVQVANLTQQIIEGSRHVSAQTMTEVSLAPVEAKRIADYLYLIGYRRSE